MSVQSMRDALKYQYYYAERWCQKVDKMGDNQVIAIYNRLRSSGQLRN